MKIRHFQLILVSFFLSFLNACSVNYESDNKEAAQLNTRETKEENSENLNERLNWRNPFLTPLGVDISRVIRGYFMVGDFTKMLQFVIVPNCYEKQEIIYSLRKSSWGYEIKAVNLQWQADSSFLLTIKTNIQQTQGSEQYIGRIINDTAKIYLFPEKENLFPFFGKENINEPCELKRILNDIQFGFNDSKILSKSLPALKILTAFLKKNETLNAYFIGHTSNEGTETYNQKLSEDRANAIVNYLIKHGISKSRLTSRGMGALEPILPNNSLKNKERNRRVEIIISKK